MPTSSTAIADVPPSTWVGICEDRDGYQVASCFERSREYDSPTDKPIVERTFNTAALDRAVVVYSPTLSSFNLQRSTFSVVLAGGVIVAVYGLARCVVSLPRTVIRSRRVEESRHIIACRAQGARQQQLSSNRTAGVERPPREEAAQATEMGRNRAEAPRTEETQVEAPRDEVRKRNASTAQGFADQVSVRTS